AAHRALAAGARHPGDRPACRAPGHPARAGRRRGRRIAVRAGHRDLGRKNRVLRPRPRWHSRQTEVVMTVTLARATLRLVSTIGSAADVTAALGIEPSESWERGQI